MHPFKPLWYLFFSVSVAATSSTVQAGGLLGIDHLVSKSDIGIWSRDNQLTLQYGAALLVLGGAMWEGNESRLGKTFWKASESMIIGSLASATGKLVFQRSRPRELNGPDAWFSGTSSKSFPSGEVTHITSIVVPFIAEYKDDHPAVWGLAALPIYDSIARMKSQAHWQSDVLAAMALGTAIGLYVHGKPEGLFIQALPQGITVGLKKRF